MSQPETLFEELKAQEENYMVTAVPWDGLEPDDLKRQKLNDMMGLTLNFIVARLSRQFDQVGEPSGIRFRVEVEFE